MFQGHDNSQFAGNVLTDNRFASQEGLSAMQYVRKSKFAVLLSD